MTTPEILSRFPNAKQSGDGWTCNCPAHEDHNASLSIGQGESGTVIKCHAGCDTAKVCQSVGLSLSDLFPTNGPASGSQKRIIATYDYTDRNGKLIFQVVRFEPKDFRQRKPDPSAKEGWDWKVKGVQKVPFRLPQLLAAVTKGCPVFICEGEKDVLAMERAGFAATCNAGGAGKWQAEFGEYLKGSEVIIIADKDEPGRKHAKQVADSLKGQAACIRVLELPDANGNAVKDAADYLSAGGQAPDLDELAQAAPIWGSEPVQSEIDTLLSQRRFDFNIVPAPLRSIYELAGHVICTPANLTALTANVKAGKSACLGGMMGAAMTTNHESDMLGFSSRNPNGLALLHFDSEQSPDDHWHGNARVLKRAGLNDAPAWFYSYCLTGLDFKTSFRCVSEAIKRHADSHGGVHSMLLDGIADFVADVNDSEESNAFVAILHGMAIKYDCPIIGVIHFNPGSEKTRGHLGSQFERKAETNLRLDKTDETTTIWSEKQRRAPIPKESGPCFTWSEEFKMHVSTATHQKSADMDKAETYKLFLDEAFKDRPAMKYSELVTTIKDTMRIAIATAERRAKDMSRLKVIKKSVAGLWTKGY